MYSAQLAEIHGIQDRAQFLRTGHGKALPAQRILCCRLSAASTADCGHCQPASRRPSTLCERRWLHSNLPHSTADCTFGLWCDKQRTAALYGNWHFGHIHVSVPRHHLHERRLNKGEALGHWDIRPTQGLPLAVRFKPLMLSLVLLAKPRRSSENAAMLSWGPLILRRRSSHPLSLCAARQACNPQFL